MLEFEFDCLRLEVAEQLENQVEGHEIPSDFEPGDIFDNEVLANIRHEYTNYEELLSVLPPQCIIRAMPISDSGACRSVIPVHADQ